MSEIVAEESRRLDKPTSENQPIWRYLDFPKFWNLLEHNALRFARADTFDDPYEGLLPLQSLEKWVEDAHEHNKEVAEQWNWGGEIDVTKGMLEENPLKVLERHQKCAFLSCWNATNHESSALWKANLKSESGVVIKSTYENLRDSFTNVSEDQIEIGMVEYVDFNQGPEHLPDNYVKYPFRFKEQGYSYEKEMRALLYEEPSNDDEYEQLKYQNIVETPEEYLELKRQGPPINVDADFTDHGKGRYLDVDFDTLIDEIRISPLGPDWHKEFLEEEVAKSYRINADINFSELSAGPTETFEDVYDEDFLTINELTSGDYEDLVDDY